jgi:DNA-directed RNA polymerase specialized sigma24 family protein
MPDRTVVADVIAGDVDGFGAAYDQYAASLYSYCRSMLPEGEAAEAVLDTFLIAAAKLDGLGDPGRLGAWLQAVARNECLRRLGPSGAGAAGAGAEAAGPGKPESAEAGDEFAAATLPARLRGKVLAACTDNTPAGRAQRASAAHRAGAFDQAGFPRAIGPSGPRWWRRLQRHPGLASLAGLLVPLVVAAGVAAMLAAGGGSHRAAAVAVRSGTDISAPVSSAVPSQTHPAVPARQVTATATANATPPTSAPTSVPAGASSPAAPTGRGTPSSPSQPSASPSPSPSPSPSSSPARGYLLVAPGQLSLTSTAGTPVSGSFELTAVNGPVPQYAVQVGGHAGQVSVSPAGGSLPANGIVTVTVTVTSKVALTTQVTVAPNGVSVTVVYTPKPKPKPTPTSKGGGG